MDQMNVRFIGRSGATTMLPSKQRVGQYLCLNILKSQDPREVYSGLGFQPNANGSISILVNHYPIGKIEPMSPEARAAFVQSLCEPMGHPGWCIDLHNERQQQAMTKRRGRLSIEAKALIALLIVAAGAIALAI